jgi:hypothetical protein
MSFFPERKTLRRLPQLNALKAFEAAAWHVSCAARGHTGFVVAVAAQD